MTSRDTSLEERDRSRRCPICGKPPVEALAPFCSTRCADVDLHRWLKGTYAIPVEPDDPDAEEET